jgi:hypothetical protein
LSTGTAHADVHCQAIAGGSPRLVGIDARVRLAFIREQLTHDARRARIWAWTWAGIYSALTVSSIVLATTLNTDKDRTDNAIGAGAAAFGLGVLIVMPLAIMRDQRWLERRLRQASADEDPCAELADAERLLLRDAKSEAFGTGPLVHAGNVLFNVGLALVLGAGLGHWDAAAITSMTGIVVGELQSFTQPTGAVRTLRDYREARMSSTGQPLPDWFVVPTASPTQVGLSLGLHF